MTRIRATCPTCGEVELLAADLVLHRVLDADGDVRQGTCYRFSCPGCAVVVEKAADEHVAELLVSGGVPTEDRHDEPPRRPRPLHPEMPSGGPPLTLDDLLDLHLALEDPAWFDQMVATTPLMRRPDGLTR